MSDRIIITTESIIFRRVSRTDAGQYQLSTTNQAGTAMAILVLQIGRKFLTFSNVIKSIRVWQHDNYLTNMFM